MLSISTDVNGWQIPHCSTSPVEPDNDDISTTKSRDPIVSNGGDDDDEGRGKQYDVVATPTTTRSAGDHHEGDGGHDEDTELFCRPVRRGVALAQSIHDEYLVCKICLEDYKSPKSLDCMHTFCEECIESHVMSESTYKKYSDYRDFTCPLCRKRTQLPLGGVRKLPDNNLVGGLMKSVAKRRPLAPILSFVKCDICRSPISYFRSSSLSSTLAAITADSDLSSVISNTTSSAGARCLDCCKVMCAECAAAHRSTPVTRSHSVYDPDVVAGVLKDPNAMACREHCNETVEYYCVDCQRCVCLLCAFDDQAVEPHVSHELVDFNTAANRHQSTLRELSDHAAAESTCLESELAALTTCADHVDSIRRLIQSTAESFRRMIDADERTLLSRLEAMYGGSDTLINGRAAALALKERVGRLTAVRRLAETVAERRGIELLLLHEEVENRLRREQQQLVLERQKRGAIGGCAGPSGREGDGVSTGMPTEGVIRKRVEFVSGVVNLGRLDEIDAGETAGIVGSHGDVQSEAPGCCPTCRRRSVVLRDHSTMTVLTEVPNTPTKQDKAVNTRARGLLHSGGGGKDGGGRSRSGSRSTSFSSGVVDELCEERPSQSPE